MNGDQAMRGHSATLPAPEFSNPAWVTPPDLAGATVAIVTSAALYADGDEAFGAGEAGYRLIDRERRDLVMGHWSPKLRPHCGRDGSQRGVSDRSPRRTR